MKSTNNAKTILFGRCPKESNMKKISPQYHGVTLILKLDLAVAKKMVTCRFYQNALRVLSKSTWKKMTISEFNGLKF